MVCMCVLSQPTDTSRMLNAIVRDFIYTTHKNYPISDYPPHKDFSQDKYLRDCGILDNSGVPKASGKMLYDKLDVDNKPVALKNPICLMDNGIYYNSWYRDTENSIRVPIQLKFNKVDDVLLNGKLIPKYRYENNYFWPIDNDGWKSKSGESYELAVGNDHKQHNFHFTLEMSLEAIFIPGTSFKFRGDDDLWVFINGIIAMDLGGLHASIDGEIKMSNSESFMKKYNLTVGQPFNFRLFFAERCTTASRFIVETTIYFENFPKPISSSSSSSSTGVISSSSGISSSSNTGYPSLTSSSSSTGSSSSSTGISSSSTGNYKPIVHTRPTVDIVSLYGNETNKMPIPVVVRFNESVIDFTIHSISGLSIPDDLACMIGPKDVITDGLEYSFDFTLSVGYGRCEYWIEDSVVKDLDGDYNLPSNRLILQFDETKSPSSPYVTINYENTNTLQRFIINAFVSKPVQFVDWSKVTLVSTKYNLCNSSNHTEVDRLNGKYTFEVTIQHDGACLIYLENGFGTDYQDMKTIKSSTIVVSYITIKQKPFPWWIVAAGTGGTCIVICIIFITRVKRYRLKLKRTQNAKQFADDQLTDMVENNNFGVKTTDPGIHVNPFYRNKTSTAKYTQNYELENQIKNNDLELRQTDITVDNMPKPVKFGHVSKF